MAGSPGSGKTEFASEVLNIINKNKKNKKFIHLDTDYLRSILPQYKGINSDQMQRASTILFDKVFDHVLKNSQNVIVDTTFASPKAIENVQRCLKRDRKIKVIYIYQEEEVSWQYTLSREVAEGRKVPREVFEKARINSIINAKKIISLKNPNIMIKIYQRNSYKNYEEMNEFINKIYFELFEKENQKDV